jgi:rhamnosyltransferase
MEAVAQIGGLDSDLFIDYVDYEWCLRARARGWRVVGLPSVRMTHALGDEVRLVFGRQVLVHRPRRQYYLIRNAVLLARRRSLPRHWRLHLLGRALRQFVGHTLLCAPRATRLQMDAARLWSTGWPGAAAAARRSAHPRRRCRANSAAPSRDPAPTLQPGR